MYSTNINVLHKFKKDLKQSSSSRYSLNWHRIYLAFNQFYLLKCFPISIQKQQKDYHVTSHLCIKNVYLSLPQLNGTAIFPYNNSSHLGKRNTNAINQISQCMHRTSLLLPFLSTKPMQKYLKWFFKQRSPYDNVSTVTALRQCRIKLSVWKWPYKMVCHGNAPWQLFGGPPDGNSRLFSSLQQWVHHIYPHNKNLSKYGREPTKSALTLKIRFKLWIDEFDKWPLHGMELTPTAFLCKMYL